MTRLHVAIVCAEETMRLEAAKAFDGAPGDWIITLHEVTPPSADVVVTTDGSDGSVRFDPARPLDVLEEIARASRSASAVVPVVGSSGGCGATSVALHLAAASPASVCFVDAKPDSGASLRLGLDLVADAAPEPIPVLGGFGFVAATDAGLCEQVAHLRSRFDSLVIDAPADRLGEIADAATAAVLVLAPALPSARRAASILERYEEIGWAVVTNRLGPGGETRRPELARVVGRQIGLQLPCSPGLRDAEDDDGLLTSLWSPWLRRVAKLARAVL